MERKILQKGDPALNQKCHPVTKFDVRLHALLDDLTETLLASGGVGLAAPQIGILRRAVVVEDTDEQIIELVNPEIVSEAGEQDGLEGCLSLPDYFGFIKRPMTVVVRAQDRDGQWFERKGEGLTARCFCHELEHLDGHLFDERCDRLYTGEELDRIQKEQEGQQQKAGKTGEKQL